MAVEQLKSLIGLSRRGLNWKDERPRSPKELGDMSGVVLSRVGSASAVGIQDFNYDTIAQVLFCNDLAWTCIELVSTTAAMGKLKVRRKNGKDFEYLPDHPLQKLLDFPNASMTQFDLVQSYVVHQRLFGTVAMLLLRDDMVSVCPVCVEDGSDDCLHKLYFFHTGSIGQIMPVHPSNITEDYITDENGNKRKVFFYVPEPNRRFPIHPDNIITDPFYNTNHGWYGVSPTFLLQRWLNLDMGMTHQIKELFDNGSIPSMIVSMKPGQNFTYEQEPETLMKMMKDKWIKEFSSSSQKQKTPAFVYGDVSVERLQERIDDSVATGLYTEIQKRVCATYGVPPTLYEMGVKFGSGQTGNSTQAERDFYNRTISKILTRFALKINRLVVPTFGEADIEVVWDLTEMGIANFLIDAKRQSILKDWEMGLTTRDEARTSLGHEPVGGEYGDDFYRLSVMSDGSNTSQAQGMDNRLQVAQPKNPGGNSSTTTEGN